LNGIMFKESAIRYLPVSPAKRETAYKPVALVSLPGQPRWLHIHTEYTVTSKTVSYHTSAVRQNLASI
jgi:hypothetical protein